MRDCSMPNPEKPKGKPTETFTERLIRKSKDPEARKRARKAMLEREREMARDKLKVPVFFPVNE